MDNEEKAIRQYEARSQAKRLVNALQDVQIEHFAKRLLEGDQKLVRALDSVDRLKEEVRMLREEMGKAGAALCQEMISLLDNRPA